MSLPGWSVRHPVGTWMLLGAVCLMGLLSLFQLPVDLMPNSGPPSITIMIGVRGGLSPEDIESLVTKPVEEAVATSAHLKGLLSVCRKDRATITLTFEPGTDVSFAGLEVSERLSKIKNKLPKDIEKPIIAHYAENDYPIIILALTSDKKSPEELRDLVDNGLKPTLLKVNGVANVEVGGGRERKILVEFDQGRLEAYRLSILQITNQIGANNLNLLSGKLENRRDTVLLRTLGQFRTIDDMKNMPVSHSKEGTPIRLGDVAEVRDFYLEPQSYARLDRKPTVSVYVQKASDTNTLRVAARVRAAVKAFQIKSVPPEITLKTVSDQSIFIQEAVSNVIGNLTWGAFFTWLVIFFFLKEWRHTTVVFLSVPVAVLGTLAGMWLTGLSLDVMTLSAIALGIGMVVDGSTVVIENILHTKKRSGVLKEDDILRVTVEATEELTLSLAASTLTVLVVFLPIVFINKQVRLMYSGLALTLTFSLLASLLVALTLVPMLAGRLFVPQHAYGSPETIARLRKWWAPVGLVLVQLRERFPKRPRFSPLSEPEVNPAPLQEEPATRKQGFFKVHRWADQGRQLWRDQIVPRWHRLVLDLRTRPRATYVGWCAWAVRRQGVLILGLVAAMAVCGFIYVEALPKDFMGSSEPNEFIIFVELPAGAKLDISDQIVGEVEKVLSETPEIAQVVKTAASRVEGWSSKVYVTLVSREERSRSVQDVIDHLRPRLAEIGEPYETFIYFSAPESSKEFLLDVFGHDYAKLHDVANAMAGKLQNVPGLADIKLRYKPGRPEIQIKLDKDRAALFGLTVKEVAEYIHNQIRGLRATWFSTESNQIEVVTRDQEKFRKNVEDIPRLTILNPKGELVSVSQLGELVYALTPSEVWRKDKQRMIQVSANRERTALSTAAERSMKQLRGLEIPEGVFFQVGGDYVDMRRNEKEFVFAFLVMVALVFIVLASLFESYRQALLLMTTLPMALVGAIPLLWITRTHVTMSVYIGIIMMGGIATTAAIILVERINFARNKGQSLERAVLESSYIRLSPILNTSLTTIVDLVPMALSRSDSSALWKPLALTVIGGTTASMLLTLFMIPSLYFHLHRPGALTHARIWMGEMGREIKYVWAQRRFFWRKPATPGE